MIDLKFMSWNIRALDWREREDEAVNVIESQKPMADVLCIQEASPVVQETFIRRLEFIGYNVHNTMRTNESNWNPIATLSALGEPRVKGATMFPVEFDCRPYTPMSFIYLGDALVVNVHLCPASSPLNNEAQGEELAGRIGKWAEDASQVILCGDLNSPGTGTSYTGTFGYLKGVMPGPPPPIRLYDTFEEVTGSSPRANDHIMVDEETLTHVRSATVVSNRAGSDHSAITATMGVSL